MAVFTELEYPVDIKQIKKIENFIGLSFPTDYKEHLLKYNGGQCEPNIFSFVENGEESESCIDWFLAIYDGAYDNLEKYIKIYKIDDKRLSSHILPIAHDPGGNLICISCGKKDNGSIFFWNHEKEVDYSTSDNTDYSNMYFIANSFKEFLEKLR